MHYVSVLKSRRRESNVEFLRKTRDLEVATIKMTDKKAKKHKSFLFEYLVRPAANACGYVKTANAIYVRDKEDYARRMKYLQRAMDNLQAYTTQLDIFYELYKSDGLSKAEMENLCALLVDSRRLIDALIKSDRKRYSKI